MQITPRHWVLALALALVLHLAFLLLSGLQKDKQTSLAGGGTRISLDLAGDGQTAAESAQEAAVQSTNSAVTPENTVEASEAVPAETQVEEKAADIQPSALPEKALQQVQPQEEAKELTSTEPMAAVQAEVRETRDVAEAVDASETADAVKQETRQAQEPEPQTAQAVPSEQETEAQPEKLTARHHPDKAPPRKPQNRQVARKPPQNEPQETSRQESEPTPQTRRDSEGSEEKEQAAMGNSGAGASATNAAGQTETPGTGDAETADALQRYLGELGLWLERHKDYPRAARQRRQEGTAVLRFVIDRAGQVLEYSIEKSAGHSLLDREVEAMIERAQPLPPPPDELSQARLEFRVPLSFKLR
ncbi:energy transducer TonB family protein [Fodinicurvata fenggangensis]|uniref:energy transducer TonB family protein n=1 Tax=Fodinicurvata fenggangensis TaxID=1121830 RepID=UPI00047A60E9|nr:energy transducer TonB [Fodinicurvata fenggangensis]